MLEMKKVENLFERIPKTNLERCDISEIFDKEGDLYCNKHNGTFMVVDYFNEEDFISGGFRSAEDHYKRARVGIEHNDLLKYVLERYDASIDEFCKNNRNMYVIGKPGESFVSNRDIIIEDRKLAKIYKKVDTHFVIYFPTGFGLVRKEVENLRPLEFSLSRVVGPFEIPILLFLRKDIALDGDVLRECPGDPYDSLN